jgi:hypothetical protein
MERLSKKADRPAWERGAVVGASLIHWVHDLLEGLCTSQK